MNRGVFTSDLAMSTTASSTFPQLVLKHISVWQVSIVDSTNSSLKTADFIRLRTYLILFGDIEESSEIRSSDYQFRCLGFSRHLPYFSSIPSIARQTHTPLLHYCRLPQQRSCPHPHLHSRLPAFLSLAPPRHYHVFVSSVNVYVACVSYS